MEWKKKIYSLFIERNFLYWWTGIWMVYEGGFVGVSLGGNAHFVVVIMHVVCLFIQSSVHGIEFRRRLLEG